MKFYLCKCFPPKKKVIKKRQMRAKIWKLEVSFVRMFLDSMFFYFKPCSARGNSISPLVCVYAWYCMLIWKGIWSILLDSKSIYNEAWIGWHKFIAPNTLVFASRCKTLGSTQWFGIDYVLIELGNDESDVFRMCFWAVRKHYDLITV